MGLGSSLGLGPRLPLSGVTLGKPFLLFSLLFLLRENVGYANLMGFLSGEPNDINNNNGQHSGDGNYVQALCPDESLESLP